MAISMIANISTGFHLRSAGRMALLLPANAQQDGRCQRRAPEHHDGRVELLPGDADQEVRNSPDDGHCGEQHPPAFRHRQILVNKPPATRSQFIIESTSASDGRGTGAVPDQAVTNAPIAMIVESGSGST